MRNRYGIFFGVGALSALSLSAHAAHVPVNGARAQSGLTLGVDLDAHAAALFYALSSPLFAAPNSAAPAYSGSYGSALSQGMFVPVQMDDGSFVVPNVDVPPSVSPQPMPIIGDPAGADPMLRGLGFSNDLSDHDGMNRPIGPPKPDITAVPLPTPFGLCIAGLVGISAVRRRRAAR